MIGFFSTSQLFVHTYLDAGTTFEERAGTLTCNRPMIPCFFPLSYWKYYRFLLFPLHLIFFGVKRFLKEQVLELSSVANYSTINFIVL